MKFTLTPFRPSELADQINGEIKLTGDRLSCRFVISPCSASIKWPTPSNKVSPKTESDRHHKLWQHTCFEVFLGLPGGPEYIELNIASNGKWQCYQFDEVREGMRISEMLTLVGSELKLNKNDAYFDFTLAHSFPIDAATQIKTGISVVIETQSTDNPEATEFHYYALAHLGPLPDFHRRDAHIIQLTPDQL